MRLTTTHTANLLFTYPDATADAIHRALTPEAAHGQVPKTRADITRDNGTIRIHIHAEDLSALRAAVNSYARWVDAAARAAGVADERRT